MTKSDKLCVNLTQTDTDMTIKSWSYSRLLDFEACPLRAKLKYVDKIPEAKHPAAERGTAIHMQAEDFVQGVVKKLPETLHKWDEDFLMLRDKYLEGSATIEGEWGFDDAWLPTEYKGAWLRMKADALVLLSDTTALVIDYKTGKRDNNEVKHGEQVQLYAIAAFIRYPALKSIAVELWYIDKEFVHKTEYKRAEALRYVQVFDTRARKMIGAKSFPANPTQHTCKWCPFSPAKGGQCTYGVREGQSALTAYRAKFG